MADPRALPGPLSSAGAIVADSGPSLGLPLHYGWPADEQERFERGLGFAYLGEIGVVTVAGPDRLSWLTTLSSQILSDLRPGQSREVLLLDPQGRVTFQFGALDDGAKTWLLTERQFSEDLAQFLKSMQFMLRVEVEDESAGFRSVLTSSQSEEASLVAASAVADLGGRTWADPWPEVAPGGARYFTGEHPAEHVQFRVYVCPVGNVDSFVGLLLSGAVSDEGATLPPLTPVGSLAAEATRVAAWRPLRSREVDERTMPSELDWLRTAVHLGKGCYCGQESVARIVNLGKPPRRLVFLQLDGSGEALPEPGAAVEYGGRQVGVITSVARHWEMGPIALALVKRNLDPTAAVMVGGVDAVQELIVPVEGRSDHSPAERPGAGLKKLDAGKRDIRTRGPGAGG